MSIERGNGSAASERLATESASQTPTCLHKRIVQFRDPVDPTTRLLSNQKLPQGSGGADVFSHPRGWTKDQAGPVHRDNGPENNCVRESQVPSIRRQRQGRRRLLDVTFNAETWSASAVGPRKGTKRPPCQISSAGSPIERRLIFAPATFRVSGTLLPFLVKISHLPTRRFLIPQTITKPGALKRRQETRFKNHAQYASGWRDGYDICRKYKAP